MLTPLQRTSSTSLTDHTNIDGEHRYAVSSIRTANAQEGESAQSVVVSAVSDATLPRAPDDLVVSLIAQGITGQWTAVAPDAIDYEPVTYRVYRAVNQPISDVSSLTPLYEHLGDSLFVDSNPSGTEHAYVVTAVDSVGNESAPSNTEYENFGLLPVSQLTIVQEEDGAPVINWVHNGADIIGFELAVFNLIDGSEVIESLHAGILTENSFEDTQFSGDSRYYQIIAVDAQQQRSIARRLLLPKLQLTTVDNSLKRGIMNVVQLQLENLSNDPVEQLRVETELNGITHHSNQSHDLAAGETISIPMVLGGYQTLADSISLTHRLISEPHVGEKVTQTRHQTVSVTNAAMVLGVQATNLTQGGTGEISFTLENNSDIEVEVVVAKNNNSQDSGQVHIQLLDKDNNLIATYPFRQIVGNHVVTLSNGVSVLRIPAHTQISSIAYVINVPATDIIQGQIKLSIDQIHYHYGQQDAVTIDGLSRTQDVSLQASAYYAQISSITPALSHGDEDIVISGQVFDRSDNSAMSNASLMLYIRNNGFERSAEILSNATGQFTYTFSPLTGESGAYTISVLHPSEHGRPVQGEFTIQQVTFSPAIYNLSVPRNKDYTLYLTVNPGKALATHNLRLAYLDGDQSETKARGITLQLPAPVDITAGSSQKLAITFNATGEAPQSGTLVLRINSDEYNPDNIDNPQSIGLFTLHYQLVESLPSLYFTPNYLETGLAQQQQITETIILENRGLGSMDDIHLSLLNDQDQTITNSWLNIITPTVITSLAPGQTSAVRLGITPGSDIIDGIYSFKLRVQSANHPTRDINIFISVTQSGEGQVLFKISDIYTATLDSNNQPIPGLQGARINIQNELVPTIEFSLTSDQLGEAWFTNVPPGFYRYRSSATNHSETAGRISIKPGITLSQEVFMDYNLITVQWEVNEITLEDRYEIILHTVYEVNVPAAVVVAEPGSIALPQMQVGQVYNGEFTLTNHGLIRADNVTITLPQSDNYFSYELMQNIPSSIAAQHQITIAYRVIATSALADQSSNDGNATGGGCSTYVQCTNVDFQYECANGTQTKGTTQHCTTTVYGTCSTSGEVYSSSGGTGGGGITGGYGGGSGGSVEQTAVEGAQCIPRCPCKNCKCPSGGGGGGGGGPGPGPGPGPTFGILK